MRKATINKKTKNKIKHNLNYTVQHSTGCCNKRYSKLTLENDIESIAQIALLTNVLAGLHLEVLHFAHDLPQQVG